MSDGHRASDMLRWIALLLIVLLIGLQLKFWFGDGGMREVHWLHQQLEAQRVENARLLKRNQELAAEVADLKRGEQAIEGRAREVLGLIKPGEVFYQVVEPAAAASTDEH